jgi:3,4-dihydroxy 2-butanone 4-phosphate synthase/GTP cyclohydrolase II
VTPGTLSVTDLARRRKAGADATADSSTGRTAIGPAPESVPGVTRVARTALPSRHGAFTAIGYRDLGTGDEHLALVSEQPGTLVRVHSECLTGDALGSLRCDCGPQLREALEQVATEGGAVVYLGGHEGRGIGLLAKLAAYALQDRGLDTVAANLEQGLPADARSYAAAAAILADLGLHRVRLLTNNPAKVAGLEAAGITVTERVPHLTGVTAANTAYLAAKRDLMGHALPSAPGPGEGSAR